MGDLAPSPFEARFARTSRVTDHLVLQSQTIMP